MIFVGANSVFAQGAVLNPGGSATGNTDLVPEVKKETTANNTFTKLQNPLKAESIQEVIYLAVDIAIYVGVAFSILAIIFIGFKFVFAQGKPDAIKEAQLWFFYVIIGLAILISSKVIVEIVKNTFIRAGVVNEDVFRTK